MRPGGWASPSPDALGPPHHEGTARSPPVRRAAARRARRRSRAPGKGALPGTESERPLLRLRRLCATAPGRSNSSGFRSRAIPRRTRPTRLSDSATMEAPCGTGRVPQSDRDAAGGRHRSPTGLAGPLPGRPDGSSAGRGRTNAGSGSATASPATVAATPTRAPGSARAGAPSTCSGVSGARRDQGRHQALLTVVAARPTAPSSQARPC